MQDARARAIVPTTRDKIHGMVQLASGLRTEHDYYIKDITTLDQWRELCAMDRSVQRTRVWCPLNSYNIPSPGCERDSLLCLQGAGDLFMMTGLLPVIKPRVVYTYAKYSDILFNQAEVHGLQLGNPSELDNAVYQRRCEYTIGFPLALRQSLWTDAVRRGWDHYDWKRLMLGLPWAVVSKPYAVYPNHAADWGVRKGKVFLHLTASSPHRSAPWLLDALLSGIPYAEYVLLGGKESAHIPSSPRLTNLAGKLGYRDLYSCLSGADIVVAVDSVVLHMAAAGERAYVLGLYGYTPATWAGWRSRRTEVMEAAGMDKLKPGAVVQWVKSKLSAL